MGVSQKIKRCFLAVTGLNRRRRRYLIVAYTTAIITAIFYFLVFSGNWLRDNVCQSEDCVALANHIKAFVDESAEPCDGFHNFVCGNFVARQTTTPKQQSVFQMLNEKKNRAIRDLVTNATLTNETKIYKSLETQRRFYRLCTAFQSQRMNLKAHKVLEADIQELSKPPWSQLTSDHVWLVPMIMAKRRGAFHNFFLNLEIQKKAGSDHPIFHIGPPSMDLMRIMKPLENTHNAEKMIRIINFFGKSIESFQNTTQDLSKIVRTFLQIVPKFHGRQSGHMVRTEFENLHAYMSQYYIRFDVATFIEEFIKWNGLSSGTFIHVSVDFTDDSYFRFLGNLVRTVPESTWRLFAVATIILKECPYLSGWL
ncbi:uncharacterized protein LOC109533190 [Dendroctonus ponderosae]|nr:uncharacterized protein LOC109533190 [Dendroctonus ponderosae]